MSPAVNPKDAKVFLISVGVGLCNPQQLNETWTHTFSLFSLYFVTAVLKTAVQLLTKKQQQQQQ